MGWHLEMDVIISHQQAARLSPDRSFEVEININTRRCPKNLTEITWGSGFRISGPPIWVWETGRIVLNPGIWHAGGALLQSHAGGGALNSCVSQGFQKCSLGFRVHCRGFV